MYKASDSFIRDLKNKDRHLDCTYFPKAERFMITWTLPLGEPLGIHVVQTDTNQFRFPDYRELKWLSERDLENTTMSEQMQQAARFMENVEEKAEKSRRDMIHERTLDAKYQLKDYWHKLFIGPKGHKPFRRIEPKSKGYKVLDNRKIK